MKKRKLFDELVEGFDALKDQRQGKITLRTHTIEAKPVPKITGKEIVELRERMHVSRAVFANRLRTNVRTLENWEQERAQPSAQAVLLIKLVERNPEMLEILETI